MIRKTYVLSIVILLGLSSFGPLVISTTPRGMNSFASMQSRPENIITVDDEPGDADYTSIKEALNHSTAGDTIEVYSGIYYESNFTLSKPNVTLQGIPHELNGGEDTGKPFIYGQGTFTVSFIKSTGILLDGFQIENKDGDAAIVVDGAYNCQVSHNDINKVQGPLIAIDRSDNIQIFSNNLSSSRIRQGIVIHEFASNITVSGNTITDMSIDGIFIWSSNNNIIIRNIIRRCPEGITVIGDNNIIRWNTLENNKLGLFLLGRYNLIQENNFINNEKSAKFNEYFWSFIYHFEPLSYNRWDGNYWDQPRTLPKIIFGIRVVEDTLTFYPWFHIDWHPATTLN